MPLYMRASGSDSRFGRSLSIQGRRTYRRLSTLRATQQVMATPLGSPRASQVKEEAVHPIGEGTVGSNRVMGGQAPAADVEKGADLYDHVKRP